MSAEDGGENTLRRRIAELLVGSELTAREISRRMGIAEKDVIRHLPHVSRSLSARGLRLRIRQSVCLKCGFIFKDRSRFTKPGRCPRCKATYISDPSFSLLTK
jgi:predicted Zn-ribbon and HTH transcriptional regulator